MDKSVYLAAGDNIGIEKLVQYIVRCPFSLARMINVSDDGKMKFISFIEKRQTDVIEKILRYCDLWIDPRDRDPPAMLLDDQCGFELEYVDCDEVLMDF